MKTTAVTCDRCGTTMHGAGWSQLWHYAKWLGWTLGNRRDLHYCAKCSKELKNEL